MNIMEILGLVDIPTWILLSVFTAIITYLWLTWNFNFFNAQGIPGPKPYPLFGTALFDFIKGAHAFDIGRIKHGRTQGYVMGRTPALWTYDENILKGVMVKHFDAFSERQDSNIEKGVMQHALFIQKGESWRNTRNALTPTFTGAKLKQLDGLINNCSRLLVKNVSEMAINEEGTEMKSCCGAFSMDVIASAAFGLQIDSQKDVNNRFVTMAMKFFQRPVLLNPVFFIQIFPSIAPLFKMLNISAFPKDTVAFFQDIVNRTIEQRLDNSEKRFDFLQLMMDTERETSMQNGKTTQNHSDTNGHGTPGRLHGEKSKGISRNDIVATSIVFFLAGYETTGTTLSFLLYNLALFPECQEKLFEEVKDYFKDKDNVDYRKLNELPYLEQCVNESLRMYPPASRTLRICQRDIVVEGIEIRKSMRVIIPIYAMHHDPEIYPEPNVFRPERFSPEEKANRSPYHYMPFGYGPRNCIGMRLALTEIKMAAAHLVYNFRLLPCKKTEVPISLKKTPLTTAKNGVWLKAEERHVA